MKTPKLPALLMPPDPRSPLVGLEFGCLTILPVSALKTLSLHLGVLIDCGYTALAYGPCWSVLPGDLLIPVDPVLWGVVGEVFPGLTATGAKCPFRVLGLRLARPSETPAWMRTR